MSYFRVHPSINIARVGTSKEYYLSPETAAGEVVDPKTGMFGGLPIKAGTENTAITEEDFRDANNDVRRQATRFRLFAYDQGQTSYPSNDAGREIKIGDVVGGKTIKDIVWQVHLANKKNNNYKITSQTTDPKTGKTESTEEGIVAYENGNTPPVRNPSLGTDLNATSRLQTLIMDAGPRALSANTNGSQTVFFDKTTTPTYIANDGVVTALQNYPVSFPDEHFSMYDPLGAIESLGEMTIEKNTGRLIVAGGFGKASAILQNGQPPALNDAIDNDFWFDDTSDGPVTAKIVFTDGTTENAVQGWFVCTDPGYAPQTRNVVSTWDDIYDTWVQHLQLIPSLFSSNAFNTGYSADFTTDILPILHGAFLQRWNTNLPQKGIKGHDFMATIKPADTPQDKIPSLTELIRKPSPPGTSDAPNNEDGVGGKMPLALGDAMKSFLSLTETQYFVLTQWYAGKSNTGQMALGVGEKLDRVTMENCLGGRYSPGIDLTFIVRDVNLYQQDWQGSVGPFRINMQPLAYDTACKDKPFLSQGYIPLRQIQVEPGDLCKFMSQPWHTDYNSCATHTPDPNPEGNNTLYWSWPAQRPVTVYPKDQCTYNQDTGTWSVGGMLYSVRGDEGNGTHTLYPQQQGRYQCYFDFVQNWHKVGFIIQGTQIEDKAHGGNYGSDKFLEVASLYTTKGDGVQPWPTAEEPGYTAPTNCGPK